MGGVQLLSAWGGFWVGQVNAAFAFGTTLLMATLIGLIVVPLEARGRRREDGLSQKREDLRILLDS